MMIQDLKRPHGVELLAAEIAPTNGNPNVSIPYLHAVLARLFTSTQVAMQVCCPSRLFTGNRCKHIFIGHLKLKHINEMDEEIKQSLLQIYLGLKIVNYIYHIWFVLLASMHDCMAAGASTTGASDY